MQPEKYHKRSLHNSASVCILAFLLIVSGFSHAQELYWDINGVIPGPGGTTLDALNGTWSGGATNWNTNDEGAAGTISGWVSGANPRFNARLFSELGQYQSYTVSLAENLTIGTYMEYVWGAAGSQLTIANAAGGPFAINTTDLGLVIGPNLTLEVAPNFIGTGILNLPTPGTLRLLGSANTFLGVTANDGTLEIVNTGNLTQGTGASGDFLLGETGQSSLLVSGGGTLSTRFTVLGSLVGGDGQATLTGPGSTWTTRAGFVVGFEGEGTISVGNGGVLTSQQSATLGFDVGSQGAVTVSGTNSAWNFSPFQFLTVGRQGEGELRIENGGRVFGPSLIVGDGNPVLPNGDPNATVGGEGTVWVTGANSELNLNGGSASIGTSAGVGIIHILNGGKFLSGGSRIGTTSLNGNFTPPLILKGEGTVNVSGANSEWTVSSFLRVGNSSKGTLNVLDGGKVTSGNSAIGYDNVAADSSRANGNALVSGIDATSMQASMWQVNALEVGDFGDGRLTISEGGIVRVGAMGTGTVNVAFLAPTTGIINIGAFEGGTTAGSLIAGSLAFRNGSATLNFNQTDSTTFAPNITGNGTINQRGSGTTTLTGTSTNTGSVNITDGTLLVQGALGNATTTVGANGTLGGAGTISGPVTVQDNGTVAPGASAGTITLGSLTLNNLSVLDFELSSPNVIGGVNDMIQVNGFLVLDGLLNVTPLANFGEGTYRLINYTGSLTDNILQIGDVPAGFGFDVDTTTLGQVNLLVNSDGLQFWDGANVVPNGVVNGGSGTWNTTLSNWTNPDGTVNDVWGASTAVFAGEAGVVTLSEQVDFLGLQFSTDGYVIEGSALNSLDIGEIRVDAGVVAEISSMIAGAGAVTKTGSGTAVLNSPNSYAGGTAINAGTLRTANSAALGTGPVVLNGGFLAPVGQLNINTLTWNGGSMALLVGTANSFVNVTGDIAFGAGPQSFAFQEGGGFAANTPYEILAAANLSTFDLSFLTGNAVSGLSPIFEQIDNSLFVSFVTPISGAILQNSNPVNLPTTADFIVSGAATTGTPSENNIINSLIFNPSSSLEVFNNLTVTSGNFTVGSGTATIFGGNILTPGDFNKNGAGTLLANSNFGIGSAANINAGALFVNGVFSVAQGVTVFQNALLGGSGIINGNVFNNGVLAPGNSVGTLTINGNYTQSSSGTFQLEIASLSSFDRLLVSGNASLAGTLQVLNLGKNLKYGQQYAFLQAGSISGEFDTIQMPNPSRYRGRFLTNGGTGTLLVAPTSYTLVAETPNQRRVAKALDSYIPARGNDREVVSIALDLQTEEQYPASFDQIAPTFHESIANISIEQAFAQTQLLNQRMSSVRLGAAGFQAISIDTEPLVHDKDGKSVADAKDLRSQVSIMKTPSWSLWAQGNGIFAKVTNVSHVPNYRFDGGGFLFGADHTFGSGNPRSTIKNQQSAINNSSLTTGLFGGYQGTYADYGGSGSTTINSALFGVYASYTKGGFYADAVVAGGYNNYSVRRSIDFSTIDRTARSSQDGGQFSAALNFGYDWEIGKFTLGPIAGVQYSYVGIAPFTESGADSLNLRVGQQNANSMRTTFGGRLAYTWNLTESITIIPEVRMFWLHEFLNNPRVIGAALDGGNGPGFDYLTSTPARDSVFAGAGLTAQFGESWYASAYWNIDFGRQDYLGNIVSLNLGWKF